MSLINEFRDTEEAIKQLQARLNDLQKSDKLKKELEFESKLRGLMGEYSKSLPDIIALLDPESRSSKKPRASKPAGTRRTRAGSTGRASARARFRAGGGEEEGSEASEALGQPALCAGIARPAATTATVAAADAAAAAADAAAAGNAGDAGGGGGMGPYHLLDTEEFIRVLHLNVLGTMLCIKHSVPPLVAAGFDPVAVHLFMMYWGMVSFITPPVALATKERGSANQFRATSSGT